MNLDTMSAHEILVMAVTTAYKEDYLPVIESALRKAVIREASVGTKEIYDPSTGKWYVAELIPNPEKQPFA